MPTLTASILASALFSLAACATTTVIVDDSDPRIVYEGSWVKNPIDDPQKQNNDGTLSFSNGSPSRATLVFSGVFQVAVYGAWPTVGEFKLESAYSIDGRNVTTFMPPRTISRPEYRQLFYMSGPMTTGQHHLEITNLGQQFYLDYIALIEGSIAAPSEMTSSPVTTTHVSSVNAPVSSVNTPHTGTSSSEKTVGATEEITAAHSSASSFLTHTNIPARSTTDMALTSLRETEGGSEPLPHFSSLLTTPSSRGPSTTNAAEPISTGTRQPDGSRSLSAGVYAAIEVSMLVLLIITIGSICLWRRRHRVARSQRIAPFDPGLTSMSSEKDTLYSIGRSGPHVTSGIHPRASTDRVSRAKRSPDSSGPNVTLEVAAIAPVSGRLHDMLGYGPLPSPSCDSLCTPSQSGSPASPFSTSPLIPATKRRDISHDVPATQRRSTDGGVRIAGGPPGARQDVDIETRSVTSTLPPTYQLYPSS